MENASGGEAIESRLHGAWAAPAWPGPRDFRRADFQSGGYSAPKARDRRRPENQLAHAERKDD